MPHYTWSNQSYQPGSYCFFIVLLELKIFKNKQHKKNDMTQYFLFLGIFFYLYANFREKISLNTIAKYLFPSLNVQSKNIFKKTQFRTNEQLEYIAALPRTNKSIAFHQQMLVFLANEEKRIKSNFKLKRYEIKKKLIIF